jgi:hypothetical protein
MKETVMSQICILAFATFAYSFLYFNCFFIVLKKFQMKNSIKKRIICNKYIIGCLVRKEWKDRIFQTGSFTTNIVIFVS